MDRIIKKKKKDPTPDWIIYSLKGLLLFLLFWNINHHASKSYLSVATKPKKVSKIYHTPNIEEISYNQLMSTTKPKIEHYMQWDQQEIPFLDPDIKNEEVSIYQEFSNKDFYKIQLDSFTLLYKGHELSPNKINAAFIYPDSSFILCKDQIDFATCFFPTLAQLEGDFALWLSIETEEEKTFFTKIKVSQNYDFEPVIPQEIHEHWRKITNRDKHKNIDNLSVAKPIFKENDYQFKWGNFEQVANKHRSSGRVPIGINEFKNWANTASHLYKEGDFIPFEMNVSYWRGNKRMNYCSFSRDKKTPPSFLKNECFQAIIEEIAVGDLLSLFIFTKGDFLKNKESVRMTIPIKIVAEDFDAKNAPLDLMTSVFSFQLTSIGEQSIIKMDTQNLKNETLKQHYRNSESAKVIHISDFKTIRRVITENDLFIQPATIEKSYILTDKVYKTETFPEFYDFTIQKPLIKFRNLSTVLNKTAYSLKDFNKSKKGLEMYLGEEKVKILQLNLTVVPKEGKIVEYITNNLNRLDIKKRLKKLSPETSLYFDKILIERKNGEQMVFPLATALHLK
jgi:hypothetical protein